MSVDDYGQKAARELNLTERIKTLELEVQSHQKELEHLRGRISTLENFVGIPPTPNSFTDSPSPSPQYLMIGGSLVPA